MKKKRAFPQGIRDGRRCVACVPSNFPDQQFVGVRCDRLNGHGGLHRYIIPGTPGSMLRWKQP